MTEQREQLNLTLKEQTSILEQASGMSQEQAGEKLMEAMSRELDHERGSALLKHKKLSEVVESQAREMLLTAIQRYARPYIRSPVPWMFLRMMKGRIIGREGRNIRAFEKATGVDVIIDDTVVIVSGLILCVAKLRQSLQKLISDGRIHPSKIEEVVGETGKQIDAFMMQKGRGSSRRG